MVRLRTATRVFGGRRVFSGLDLDVPAGSRLLPSGGNGSGKTTLLRCLAGTLTLTTGQALIGGERAGSTAARWLIGTCLAPEQWLYGRLSAHDNLMLAARIRHPRRTAAPAVAALDQELAIDTYPALASHSPEDRAQCHDTLTLPVWR